MKTLIGHLLWVGAWMGFVLLTLYIPSIEYIFGIVLALALTAFVVCFVVFFIREYGPRIFKALFP